MTALVISVLSILFWLPFVHAKVVKKDYTLRWYHFFLGPLLWKRPAPEPIADNHAHVMDYRVYGREEQERAAPVAPRDTEKAASPEDAGVYSFGEYLATPCLTIYRFDQPRTTRRAKSTPRSPRLFQRRYLFPRSREPNTRSRARGSSPRTFGSLSATGFRCSSPTALASISTLCRLATRKSA